MTKLVCPSCRAPLQLPDHVVQVVESFALDEMVVSTKCCGASVLIKHHTGRVCTVEAYVAALPIISALLESAPHLPVEDSRSAEELIALGYRRVSNNYRLVARIDRADWLTLLAGSLGCAVADFYRPDGGGVSRQWADSYRRQFSKDVLVVSPDVLRKIPSSTGDNVGFVQQLELTSTRSSNERTSAPQMDE